MGFDSTQQGRREAGGGGGGVPPELSNFLGVNALLVPRSEEHTSELQSP